MRYLVPAAAIIAEHLINECLYFTSGNTRIGLTGTLDSSGIDVRET